MSRRFFFQSDPNQPPNAGDSATLDSNESHHLIHVMRCGVGDSVQLFDGSGYQFDCEITLVGRREVTVQLLTKEQVNRELDEPLVIAIPFPKSDRQKFLVEKLTEIGVTEIIFLQTARSIEQGNKKTLSKLNRLVIDASKQCGRNQLMNLQGPVKLTDLAGMPNNFGYATAEKYFAHPTETDSSDSASEVTTAGSNLPVETGSEESGSGKIVLIGPEGGFDPQEIELLRQNDWRPLCLGKTILRMETAALVAATILSRS